MGWAGGVLLLYMLVEYNDVIVWMLVCGEWDLISSGGNVITGGIMYLLDV